MSNETTPITCACGATFNVPAFIARMIADPKQGPTCPACTQRRRAEEEAERPAREAQKRREQDDLAVDGVLPAFYMWASFEALEALPPNERARRSKDPTGLERAKGALEATRIVISGPAGAGKTVLASCILRAWVRERGQRPGFIDGYELAVARAHAGLGAEAPSVKRALERAVLIVDDLAAKPANPMFDATADVIHARHKSNLRTIVTHGFDLATLKAKLGDGITRRLYEDAVRIELRPSKGGQ